MKYLISYLCDSMKCHRFCLCFHLEELTYFLITCCKVEDRKVKIFNPNSAKGAVITLTLCLLGENLRFGQLTTVA